MATLPSAFGTIVDATQTGTTMISGHYETTSQRAIRCFATLSAKAGVGITRPIISIGTNAPDYDNFCPALDLESLQNVFDVKDYLVPINNPFIDTAINDVFVNVQQASSGYTQFDIFVEFDGYFQI
jgi:hypothetical protein